MSSYIPVVDPTVMAFVASTFGNVKTFTVSGIIQNEKKRSSYSITLPFPGTVLFVVLVVFLLVVFTGKMHLV